MNTRDLELFQHLSRNLHFGRTALACNITPSGLTRAIQRLEEEVGEALFLRNNRSVALTSAGKLLGEYAADTLPRYRLLKNRLRSTTHLTGQLRFYCSVTAITSILPRALKQFRLTNPGVSIQVETGDPARALTRLQNGDFDVAIAALPGQIPAGLEYTVLEETPLLFITPRYFPENIFRFDNGEINWAKTQLILPSTGLSRVRAERWFADKSIRPYIYADVAGNEAIIAMVSMGLGVGIVPRLVLDSSSLRDEVEILEIKPELKPFVIGSCTTKSNRNAAIINAFQETIRSDTGLS